MSRKKKDPGFPTSEGLPDDTSGRTVRSRDWLVRFMFGMALVFSTIAGLSWACNLWGYFTVVKPAAGQLEARTDPGLAEALTLMKSPHLFSGYEPYTGFGKEGSDRLMSRVHHLVSSRLQYSQADVRYLVHRVAFYIPAAIELKAEGERPFVPGDREVIQSIHDRWSNAVRSGFVLSIYFSLVACLMAGLFLLYKRNRLWSRFGVATLPESEPKS